MESDKLCTKLTSGNYIICKHVHVKVINLDNQVTCNKADWILCGHKLQNMATGSAPALLPTSAVCSGFVISSFDWTYCTHACKSCTEDNKVHCKSTVVAYSFQSRSFDVWRDEVDSMTKINNYNVIIVIHHSRTIAWNWKKGVHIPQTVTINKVGDSLHNTSKPLCLFSPIPP